VKLTTHLQLVTRSVMRGAISPLPPNKPLRRGAQLKHRENLVHDNRLSIRYLNVVE
jgi:hypothetical protein